MRRSDIEKFNITKDELAVIYDWTKGLSDCGEMCDGTWGVEWDTEYGRYWERFENEEAAHKAIDEWSDHQLSLLADARKVLAKHAEEKKRAAIAKGQKIAAKNRFIKEQKTLGGHCPELKQLLEKIKKS